jgi:dTDP-4-amino-4,6-dideoxygalactose transaminase
MFSFGSDKVVSCVRGGALITNDDSIQQKIESYRGRMPQTDRLLVFQHLMHYPLFFVGRALYHVKIGKWILAFAKRLHIMNRIIYRPEKEGKQLPFYPRLLPNALALILQRQLSELEQLNAHRKAIAAVYDDVLEKKIERQRNDAESIHLRYTLFLDDAKTCRAEAKKQGILLGDWYDTVIAPRDIRMEATGYKKGDCPWAESYAKKSLNLPTSRHISERDAKRIASFVNNFFTSHNK